MILGGWVNSQYLRSTRASKRQGNSPAIDFAVAKVKRYDGNLTRCND
jgi:hypothetical protein